MKWAMVLTAGTAVLFAAVPEPRMTSAEAAEKVARIGYLGTEAAPIGSFQDELRRHGWVEGESITIEYRWATGETNQVMPQAAELARLDLDVIVVSSAPYAEAARRATSTIPIIFCTHGDPVGAGHVASLARPSGNMTGVSHLLTELSAKSLEFLTEAMPSARRVAVLWDPTHPSHDPAVPAVKDAASGLGVQLTFVPAATADEFDAAFDSMAREHVDAVLGLLSPLYFRHRNRLVDLALQHRLASVWAYSDFAEAGGLLSYGANRLEQFRRCAAYVDKILKGAKPAELPVEQVSIYELVINLKTARILGLELPAPILARAERLIE
jgi:putative tryptophan/tyrosine transport system substrate-binding protein